MKKRLKVFSTRQDLKRNPATLEESIGWEFNAVLTSFQVRAAQAGWLVIIKADFPVGPQVCFMDVTSFGRACEVAAEWADLGLLRWYPDKYPPKIKRYRPRRPQVSVRR